MVRVVWSLIMFCVYKCFTKKKTKQFLINVINRSEKQWNMQIASEIDKHTNFIFLLFSESKEKLFTLDMSNISKDTHIFTIFPYNTQQKNIHFNGNHCHHMDMLYTTNKKFTEWMFMFPKCERSMLMFYIVWQFFSIRLFICVTK